MYRGSVVMQNRHDQNLAQLNQHLNPTGHAQTTAAQTTVGQTNAVVNRQLSSHAYIDEVARHLSRFQRQPAAAAVRRISDFAGNAP